MSSGTPIINAPLKKTEVIFSKIASVRPFSEFISSRNVLKA